MSSSSVLVGFESELFAAGCEPNPSTGRARCPGHGGRGKNLSYRVTDGGRLQLKCFSGDCSREEILSGLKRQLEEGGTLTPAVATSTGQQPAGLTVEVYAEVKRLPEDHLRSLGLSDQTYRGTSRVVIPYFLRDGNAGPVRYRHALEKSGEGDLRFTWKTGSKSTLYGLWKLDDWRKASVNSVLLVEGESDCQTAWHAGVAAIGLPGANTWRDDWAAELDGFEHIYVIEEPDSAGAKLVQRLAAAPLADRLSVISLDPHKDLSALWLADPNRQRFAQKVERVRKAAASVASIQERKREQRAEEAWKRCQRHAQRKDLLRAFVQDLEAMGVVGERRAASLVFLTLVSRLFEHPVSAVLKGPSSAGKSWIADSVLRFFPESAYYRLSGMSERFLVYDPEPLAHRIVYIAEAAGLEGDIASYLVRTLLSEGRLVWGTVDKLFGGELVGRRIEKAGPTGVLITTTRVRLHPENETRLLSIPILDTPEQTRNVMLTRANGRAPEPDLSRWHALSEWLESGNRRVHIPFAKALAEAIPPVAVRLRRDFGTVLILIEAHALLHRATRTLDKQGRIIAERRDYETIRRLVADLISEGVETSVAPPVREVVEAVRKLLDQRVAGQRSYNALVTNTDLAGELGIDKSAISRRVSAALRAEYLQNHEDRRGRPKRLTLGPAPLPSELEVLPEWGVLMSCSENRGDKRSSSTSPERQRKTVLARAHPRRMRSRRSSSRAGQEQRRP